MKARALRALAAGLVAACAVPLPVRARDLWSSQEGELRLEFAGSLRELFTVGEQTRSDDFAAAALGDPACALAATFANCIAFEEVGDFLAIQSLTRLRLRFDAQLPRGFSALLVYDHELESGHLATLESQLAAGFAGETLLGAEDVILSGRHVEWRHRLYRGLLRFEHGPLELRAGRQRIAWGVGRLWNPIDRLNAIGPLALEADQSAGIDALDLRWSVGNLHGLELVVAPARDSDDARYAGRLYGTFFDTDVSVLGGLFQEAPTAGFDLARNLADAALRLEVVWTDPERPVRPIGATAAREPDPYWQVVVSIDYNLDLGTGVYLLAEHLYNGNALGFGRGRAGPLLPLFEETPSGTVVPASSAVFAGSQVASGAAHQTGVEIGYDLTPELRADVVTLVDWSGGSAVLFPVLRYTPTGTLEVSLGAQVGFGPHRSEYGERGALGYLLAEWFF